MNERYYVKFGDTQMWQEVSRRDFIAAERAAGFFPKNVWANDPKYHDTLATSGFTSGSINGKIEYSNDNTEHPKSAGQVLYQALSDALGLPDTVTWDELPIERKKKYIYAEQLVREDERNKIYKVK